jgi:2'-5' RNA ligase
MTTAEPLKGMIAIPVPGWVRREWKCRDLQHDLHITLGFMPAVTASQAEQVAWLTQSVVKGYQPFDIHLNGSAIFGEGRRVALVRPTPQLRALRQMIVTKVLWAYPGLVDVKTYPVWKPHVTLGDHALLPRFQPDLTFKATSVEVNLKDNIIYNLPFPER